eukprot:CAMPEP_0174315472 /NCGR_PEP_ID=MMETSP0810-20121108/6308_1 /TAXON_ID=73025 ORGANISM="Eutreptiella gymnastica-like, Strain CCMP1594" /NCGR_SAMPLE_ID=MMETSP0810 /ASSEMBLY_ACC=CAM_ASM_000659 /LENGTH=259 /DNA_ID=CAMNT_0015424867 /DNA_START=20 /DNA_END=799 /DNA_ORIENTATION=-
MSDLKPMVAHQQNVPEHPATENVTSSQPYPAQPAYGVPVDAAPYGMPVGTCPVAATGVPVGQGPYEGQPIGYRVPMGHPVQMAMGTPMGSAPMAPMGAVGAGMYGPHAGLNIGTQQEHDMAMVASCCCGKWGVIGTLLGCPTLAGIAGMCKGCGINLIVMATTMAMWLCFVSFSMYTMMGEDGWDSKPDANHDPMHYHRHGHGQDPFPSHQPSLLVGCTMVLMTCFLGGMCLHYGHKKYAQWQFLRASVPTIPVATVDV